MLDWARSLTFRELRNMRLARQWPAKMDGKIIRLRPRFWWAVVSRRGAMCSLNPLKKFAIQHACWRGRRHCPWDVMESRGYRLVRVSILEYAE